jgi:hypothetical protein
MPVAFEEFLLAVLADASDEAWEAGIQGVGRFGQPLEAALDGVERTGVFPLQSLGVIASTSVGEQEFPILHGGAGRIQRVDLGLDPEALRVAFKRDGNDGLVGGDIAGLAAVGDHARGSLRTSNCTSRVSAMLISGAGGVV